MRTAFVNLPHTKRFVRRYTCSYHAANFLFPPLELMSLAGIAREWKRTEAVIIDAIAENLSISKVISRLDRFGPRLIVFMTGLETFENDINAAGDLKRAFPGSTFICFGYYPTQFPKEILEQCPFIDFIIRDEPEQAFAALYDLISDGKPAEPLPGIACRNGGQIYLGLPAERIKDVDAFPFPAYALIEKEKYHEFFAPRPFALIQSSRGCPARCTYCIRTYGQKVGFRSISNLLSEMEGLVKDQGVASIRFIDDNFCMDRSRVIAICRSLLERGLKVRWSCLSRVDSLDEELLNLMKEAGCFRIYLGIETFSKRVLDHYKKNLDPALVEPTVKMMRRAGIESMGFMMIGGIQTREEFDRDVRLAIDTDLDYVVVEKVVAYPGTPLFEEMREGIRFRLFPYENRLIDAEEELRLTEWEKEFYRRFYLRTDYWLKKIFKIRYWRDSWVGLTHLVNFTRGNASLAEPRRDLI